MADQPKGLANFMSNALVAFWVLTVFWYPYRSEERKTEIERLKDRVARWSGSDGGVRQFVGRYYDAVKLILAGNVSGILGVSAFLFAAKGGHHWMIIASKVCWITFSVGCLLCALAYWTLHHWESAAERAVEGKKKNCQTTLLRNNAKPPPI